MSTIYEMEETIEKKTTLQAIRDSIDEFSIRVCTVNPTLISALEYIVPIVIVVLLDIAI